MYVHKKFRTLKALYTYTYMHTHARTHKQKALDAAMAEFKTWKLKDHIRMQMQTCTHTNRKHLRQPWRSSRLRHLIPRKNGKPLQRGYPAGKWRWIYVTSCIRSTLNTPHVWKMSRLMMLGRLSSYFAVDGSIQGILAGSLSHYMHIRIHMIWYTLLLDQVIASHTSFWLCLCRTDKECIKRVKEIKAMLAAQGGK